MFSNIGSKIKIVAIVSTVIGMIISVVYGFVLVKYSALVGILVVVLGCLGSWLGSFTLYGLGQLIENSDIIVKQLKKINSTTPDGKGINQNNTNYSSPLNTLNYNNNSNSTRKVPVTMESCRKCGGYYDVGSKECPHCGNKSKQHQEDNSANKYQQSNDNKLSYSNFVSRMRCPECGEYHDINCTECPKCGHKY